MAGLGSRFSNSRYQDPKPFIKVLNLPLIQLVLSNLNIKNAHYILIARAEHVIGYSKVFDEIMHKYNTSLLTIDKVTEGAACTVLHAHKLINNEQPLLLANSDQYIDTSAQSFIDDCESRGLDGSIMTFTSESRDSKWSYAKINASGFVEYVREKDAISEHATVGLYYFSKGKFFVDASIDMILAGDRVNGEFYTCPVYNYLIKEGKKIGIYSIQKNQMHGLGTPDDLNNFIQLKKCL